MLRKLQAFLLILTILSPNLNFVYASDNAWDNQINLKTEENKPKSEIPIVDDNYFNKLESFRYLFWLIFCLFSR